MLTSLIELNLDYTEVTDKGIAALSGLNKLESLSLDSTHVTDKSASIVRGLGALTSINLYHTLVTDKGLEQVRSALPKCHIIFDAESSLPNRRRS